ncbi:MAG: hypothetical protein R3F60_06530 [bacterium]
MRGKGLALLVMLVGAPAAAVGSFAVETAWFVPELGQAFIVGGGLEGRFSGLAGRSESPWPTRGLRLDVGWLRYADGHGRFSYGPTLGYGRSLAEPLHPDAAFQHLAFGALGRYRLASPTFFTVSFAAFAEAGPFFADAEAGTTAPEGTTWRAAAGVELFSLGALLYLSPWVFGEVAPWLGVEAIGFEGSRPALGGGVRIRLDFARH